MARAPSIVSYGMTAGAGTVRKRVGLRLVSGIGCQTSCVVYSREQGVDATANIDTDFDKNAS